MLNPARAALIASVALFIAVALTASFALLQSFWRLNEAHAAGMDHRDEPRFFQRIASFPVFLNTDVNEQTVAEIVDASEDGKTLVYTDGEAGNLGFVDIRNPAAPQAAGVVPLAGEPTSVAVAGRYALVAVNTSPSFAAPSGELAVIDIERRRIVADFDLGGQPDSVAISPDLRFAAIAIENERDEALGDGAPPQAPPGFLVVVDLEGDPARWRLRTVELTGLAERFPQDPEPEFVDVSGANVAAVTLQENNHVALVHLPSAAIVEDWDAGTQDLMNVDTRVNGLIQLNGRLTNVPREPDGVAWLSSSKLATANEGDLEGGTRDFSFFDRRGRVGFTAGNDLEHLVTRLGHYPEERSEDAGNEPENVEVARYAGEQLLFVGSERSSVVLVYRVGRLGPPQLKQVLPAGVGPEGLLAIPDRGLFVAAAEEDDREAGIRSLVTLYKLKPGESTYPTVRSADRRDGLPIPWGALSALDVPPKDPKRAYTVYDDFYRESRILALDIARRPAVIERELVLRDTLGGLALVAPEMVNADATVNLDLEGVVARPEGGFWVVSEGAGSVDDPDDPVASTNLLLRLTSSGVIEQVVALPDSVEARQRRFGFEGVAVTASGPEETIYVAFQREWLGDPEDRTRIGEYVVGTGEWRFFYYPLEAPASPNGGTVGLSELTRIGNHRFAVIERDDQAGADARIKRIYAFSLAGVEPQPDSGGAGPSFPVLDKRLVRDLVPDLEATGGAVLEKIEGLAIRPGGTAVVVNDNDGVDGSNGETQLLRLDMLLDDVE